MGKRPTFLPFVEDWWARMIMTLFFRVCEYLPARLVHTFLRHIEVAEGEEQAGNS
jgi:hypothetical protein